LTNNFSVSLIADKNWKAAILTQLRWQNRRRCWTPSHNSTSRTRLKMAEALGTVHTSGRGLLPGWWWPAGSKLVFDQMAAPVPEIMDTPVFWFFSRYCRELQSDVF
jgi:hypothetical protein